VILAGIADWALAIGDEPKSVTEALKGNESEHWQEAMKREIAQLEKLRTWKLIKPPPDANIIGSDYIFRRKRNAEGKIASHKARVVAKGYAQVYGIDYYDTFAAGVKLTSERAILAHTARQNWEIHQTDVKSAYLNADLDEEIYMKPPPGYLKKGEEGLVCRLLKGLYGLKQAGRKWYLLLYKFFRSLGFSCADADHSVFYIKSPTEPIIVGVSVDDMTIAAKLLKTIDWLKKELCQRFEISDLRELHWLLGVEITRDRLARTISLSQRAYIDLILEDFKMKDCNAVSTPMDPGAKLTHEQCPKTEAEREEMKRYPYAKVVGKVMYAYLVSFPQLGFAIRTLSQFMHNPGKAHWEAAKRVLRYLKGARESCLVLGGTDTGLMGYADSDYAFQADRHSISGYAFFLGGGAISWSSKRQSVIALSSTEAEYISLANATREAIWLRNLLGEITTPIPTPTPMFCDSQGAKSLAKDNTNHPRTKHIDVQYHYTQEAVESRKITVIHVSTEDMIADILTKPLARDKFSKFCKMLGLQSSRGGVLRY
jgi:hypothetical protein